MNDINYNIEIKKEFIKEILNNNVNKTELLLNNNNLDHEALNLIAFKYAYKNKYNKLVQLLISDPRIDAGLNDNEALIFCCKNGYNEIVKILLTNKNVDPTAQNNSSIKEALFIKNINIVSLLIQDERVKKSLQQKTPQFYDTIMNSLVQIKTADF